MNFEECKVDNIIGETIQHDNLIFEKSLKVKCYPTTHWQWQIVKANDRPIVLKCLNPYFYEILDNFLDSMLFNKKINVDLQSQYIRFTKEAKNISDEKKYEYWAKNTLCGFRTEKIMTFGMLVDSWGKYIFLDETQKIKFWKSYIWDIIKETSIFVDSDVDEHYVFSKELYDFWLSKEPNIDYFIEEAIKNSTLLTKKLNKDKVFLYLKKHIPNFQNFEVIPKPEIKHFHYVDFDREKMQFLNYDEKKICFTLFGDENEYFFKTHTENGKNWIMRMFFCFKEQCKFSFSYHPETFEVLDIFV